MTIIEQRMGKITSLRRIKAVILILLSAFLIPPATAQQILPDSGAATAHPGFDRVSGIHRALFGENYRKEWSVSTQLPVIHLSTFRGGLRPIRQGGGNQTRSLRLEDKTGMEWVIRSVEKYPEVIIPENLRETFLKDIVIDAMSAQHPYSALVVPPIAEAEGVPHAHPVIGIIAPDSVLGEFSKTFVGTVCLLEEREPTGKSENYLAMLAALKEDNDNAFDSATFLRARLLDIFLGDWDRHGDQWRFKPEKDAWGKKYVPVPRDRDQVFYTNQGFFPYIESRPYVQPFFEGFNPRIRKVGTLLFTSTLLNAQLLSQFSYGEWMKVTNDFVAKLTDALLEESLRQLPQTSYRLRHDKLLRIMKARRNDLPRAMSEYYHFLNRSAFISSSDKSELITVTDTAGNNLQVNIFKLSKDGEVKQPLFSKSYDPAITREIRFFTGAGNDSVVIKNRNSPIRLRFSGAGGNKAFDVQASRNNVSVYEKKSGTRFTGDTNRIREHLSDDSANTAIKPGPLFNTFAPLLTGGYNPDDGLLLGLSLSFYSGLDYTTTAYSIKKYQVLQSFSFQHAFSTSAFNAHYHGEWMQAVGKADVLLQADAFAPNNTQNFFGYGDESVFNKTGDYKTFYRSRFSLYKFNPALRFGGKKGNYFTVGPAIQYYRFDAEDNKGRYIDLFKPQTYDSVTLDRGKLHAGIVLKFNRDVRDSRLLPTSGYTINSQLQAYAGLNGYSKSYEQLTADFAYFQAFGAKKGIVLTDRVGGGVTTGNQTFYQSLFLGGQGNLMGYRQYRFAGQYMFFNNFEARIKLAQFANYILPGQFGLVGLYDIGRVWVEHDYAKEWHSGVGGGFYFAPAQIALVQFVLSYSSEGLYPAFTFGFRF